MLTDSELEGKASIEERVKKREILMTYTDKDSRIVICTPDQYIEAAEVHLSKDEKVDWDTVKPTIDKMNRVSQGYNKNL